MKWCCSKTEFSILVVSLLCIFHSSRGTNSNFFCQKDSDCDASGYICAFSLCIPVINEKSLTNANGERILKDPYDGVDMRDNEILDDEGPNYNAKMSRSQLYHNIRDKIIFKDNPFFYKKYYKFYKY
nr:uncharacterized protein LOC121113541 [Lepeophtheirus salmonis]